MGGSVVQSVMDQVWTAAPVLFIIFVLFLLAQIVRSARANVKDAHSTSAQDGEGALSGEASASDARDSKDGDGTPEAGEDGVGARQ